MSRRHARPEPTTTPDEALGDALEPLAPITFDCADRGTVTVSLPLTGDVWFWILTHLTGSIDPNEPGDDRAVGHRILATIALRAEHILSVACGIPIADLRAGVDADTLGDVLDRLTEQMGQEMIAASPFSTGYLAGLRAVGRVGRAARGATASAGAARSTQSKPKSTVETVQD